MAKRGDRVATEGLILESYVHANGKIGVLVEVDCETDFVARNEQFRDFAREVALCTWPPPRRCTSRRTTPADAREAERLRAARAGGRGGKAGERAERSWRAGCASGLRGGQVLLNQRHVNEQRHGGKTIDALRTEIAASTRENVVIRRFV